MGMISFICSKVTGHRLGTWNSVTKTLTDIQGRTAQCETKQDAFRQMRDWFWKLS